MKKLLIILVFLLLAASLTVSARDLEINYPSIPGAEITPQTIEGTSLPNYIKYLFSFAMIVAGLLAFAAIMSGGVRYLTSAGNPSATADAKDQIFSGVLGLIILFSSYIVLNTVNPELIAFNVPTLTAQPSAPPPLPPTEPASPDPLVRIKDLSEAVKTISSELVNVSKKLNNQMQQCSCTNTSAECYCNGLNCTPKRCLADPCKNRGEIKISQRDILAKSDEILYYKDRIASEKEDIGPELDWFVEKERLTEEQSQNLVTSLNSFILKLQNFFTITRTISQLPESCLPDKCTPSCSQSTCEHNCNACGSCNSYCYSTGCSGTPCPSGTDQLATIEAAQLEIKTLADHIISILE